MNTLGEENVVCGPSIVYSELRQWLHLTPSTYTGIISLLLGRAAAIFKGLTDPR